MAMAGPLYDDDQLADMLRVIVNHGMKVRYYHDLVGVNSRSTASRLLY
jgi:dTDP-4-amino-4,6-dideoxygalactose transaminase